MGAEILTKGVETEPIIVQKFGGSSVADLGRVGRVADRVLATHRAGHRVVVVVSAMGKTTDSLLRQAREVMAQGPSPGAAPPRRELDMLVSTGERVSMSLLSIALAARGASAISFTGSQSGIITNDRHLDARIIEVRPHRIEDELARGNIVIVAGYQGMSYRREITTLGRGGTDTTAVALAAALRAERCEIYSDVDGVYSADPRLVPEAAHLGEIDCDTLQELAENGAKVLCAQAVEWARRSGVALYARSSFDLVEGSAPRQTVVRRDAPPAGPRARAVTTQGGLCRLETTVQRADALLEELEAFDAPIRAFEQTSDRFWVIVHEARTDDVRDSLDRLAASWGETLQREPAAALHVVGAEVGESPTLVRRFRRLVAPRLYLSCAPLRLTVWGESTPEMERLAPVIHEAFVGGGA